MQPACQAYRAVLAQLHSAPYAVQAAAFWAIEACYNQSWAKVLQDGAAEEYKEFAHRYGLNWGRRGRSLRVLATMHSEHASQQYVRDSEPRRGSFPWRVCVSGHYAATKADHLEVRCEFAVLHGRGLPAKCVQADRQDFQTLWTCGAVGKCCSWSVPQLC